MSFAGSYIKDGPGTVCTIDTKCTLADLGPDGLVARGLAVAGGFAMGGMRVLEQERSRLELDFNALIAYLQEQEDFLHQLQHQSEMVRRVPVAQAAELRKTPCTQWLGCAALRRAGVGG